MAKTLIVLSVDPEFRDLCPALSDEEREGLRQLLVDDGCTDPIIYWTTDGNPIVDGHHRHEICQGEGLQFPTLGMEFPNREAACAWIIKKQLARRNLNDVQRSLLRGRLYKATKGECGGDRKSSAQNEHLIDAAKTIAKQERVGEATVRRDEKLVDAVDAIKAKSPAIAKAVENKEIPRKAAAALAAAPKSKLRTVEKAATKSARQKAVEAIANVKPDPPAEVKDQNGKPVPVCMREAFTRGRDEFKAALELCRQLKAKITAIAADEKIGVIFGGKGGAPQAGRDIDNVRRSLRFSMPHAICPYCKAKGGVCKACNGHGWVGEIADKAGREAVA